MTKRSRTFIDLQFLTETAQVKSAHINYLSFKINSILCPGFKATQPLSKYLCGILLNTVKSAKDFSEFQV